MSLQAVSIFYDDVAAVQDITLDIPLHAITALIGPSGCGKSTLLRALNRMNDRIPGARLTGQVLLEGRDIYARGVDPPALRRRVGMVFQKPNPFPKSIYANVAWGARINGFRGDLPAWVQTCLRRAALWEQVKDRLKTNACTLSGGQQQRLCIARALATNPEVLLLDEPTSALDPIATGQIEELLGELKKALTIVIVTHNMQQAARVSDETVFLYMGKMVESGSTRVLFSEPKQQRTKDYITGRFG